MPKFIVMSVESLRMATIAEVEANNEDAAIGAVDGNVVVPPRVAVIPFDAISHRLVIEQGDLSIPMVTRKGEVPQPHPSNPRVPVVEQTAPVAGDTPITE